VRHGVESVANTARNEDREVLDEMSLSLADLRPGSGETLGLPSCDGVRPGSGLKAKKAHGLMDGWPMKKDRELIQLTRENLSVDQIAIRMNISSPRVLKIAKRLGIH
jgi:hypothetical protein